MSTQTVALTVFTYRLHENFFLFCFAQTLFSFRIIRKCQILNSTFAPSLECRASLRTEGARARRLLQVRARCFLTSLGLELFVFSFSDRNELIRERERERERDRGYLSDHNSRWFRLALLVFHSLTFLLQLLDITLRFMHRRVSASSMVPSLGRLAFGQLDFGLRN